MTDLKNLVKYFHQFICIGSNGCLKRLIAPFILIENAWEVILIRHNHHGNEE